MKRLFTILLAIFAFTINAYSAPGDYDTAFNGTGIVFGGFGLGDDIARSTAVQPDGKIVVAGSAANGSIKRVFLAGCDGNGYPARR